MKTQLELPPGWEYGRQITYIEFHMRAGICVSSHKALVPLTPQQQHKMDEEIISAPTQGILLRYESHIQFNNNLRVSIIDLF